MPPERATAGAGFFGPRPCCAKSPLWHSVGRRTQSLAEPVRRPTPWCLTYVWPVVPWKDRRRGNTPHGASNCPVRFPPGDASRGLVRYLRKPNRGVEPALPRAPAPVSARLGLPRRSRSAPQRRRSTKPTHGSRVRQLSSLGYGPLQTVPASLASSRCLDSQLRVGGADLSAIARLRLLRSASSLDV